MYTSSLFWGQLPASQTPRLWIGPLVRLSDHLDSGEGRQLAGSATSELLHLLLKLSTTRLVVLKVLQPCSARSAAAGAKCVPG